MKKTTFVAAMVTSLVTFTTGCGGLSTSQMLPETAPVGQPLLRSVEIVSVSGGRKPTFGGAQSITSDMFEEALRESLEKSNLFADVGPDADLKLSAEISGQGQAEEQSFSYTGSMGVVYSIYEAAGKPPLWRRQILSSHQATAFSGAKRTVQAREGAVRENLAALISALSAWDGSDTVLAPSELIAELQDYVVGSTDITRFDADFGRFGPTTEGDDLFLDEVHVQTRSRTKGNDGRIGAEFVFLHAPVAQRRDPGESALPVALLVFENDVLSERIGPSMGSGKNLVGISDALQAREQEIQRKHVAARAQSLPPLIEAKARITGRSALVLPDASVRMICGFSGEISVLDRGYGAAELSSGMTRDEVAESLRAGNVRFELLSDEMWRAAETILIFENNRLTQYSCSPF